MPHPLSQMLLEYYIPQTFKALYGINSFNTQLTMKSNANAKYGSGSPLYYTPAREDNFAQLI